ncbi:MAG: type II toxin-antitoxin system RelE/ParE family toxin [Flavobacteriales bacterium]|nr:type II toxin-antitoxin system RelE/ParE family toxin [Flavobacteriales bacterium]
MVDVRWTNRALIDINDIANFIALDSFKYATIQINRFFDKVKILNKHPEIGRLVPEKNNPLFRELILGNYRIIYKIISPSRIDIITVHHSKRKLRNI